MRNARRPVRDQVVAQLESSVDAHRWTIAVVFPVVGVGLLAGSAAGLVPAWVAFNPLAILFGVVVMRSPLIAYLAPILDRRGLLAVGVVSAYAYVIEFVALRTGIPYGVFEYGVGLGPTVVGVPVSLPILFVPLVLNALLLSRLLLPIEWGPSARIGLAVGIVVAIDGVLDPAAVAIGFWQYAADGLYYGVPLTNFLGWGLSAFVAVTILEFGLDGPRLDRRLEMCRFALDDFVSFTLLWGGLNLLYGQWIPVGITVLLIAGLAHVERFDLVSPIGSRRPSRGELG